MQDAEYKITPRSNRQKLYKSENVAQDTATKEVVLNISLLRSHFRLPLHKSARALGICTTVLKK